MDCITSSVFINFHHGFHQNSILRMPSNCRFFRVIDKISVGIVEVADLKNLIKINEKMLLLEVLKCFSKVPFA